MRLIDADTLNAEFEKLKEGAKSLKDVVFLDAVQAVVDSVPTTECTDRWISVDEPPEEYGKYLALDDKGRHWEVEFTYKCWLINNMRAYHLTHWQPLPQPPKEKRKK